MKWVVSILCIFVFIRHGGYNWIAGEIGYSPKATYYMLGGIWESLLCATLLLIALALKPSVWRDLLVIAMSIGIIEAIQLPLCRPMVPIAPQGMELCDFLSGLPLKMTGLVLYLLVICWRAGRAIGPGRFR